MPKEKLKILRNSSKRRWQNDNAPPTGIRIVKAVRDAQDLISDNQGQTLDGDAQSKLFETFKQEPKKEIIREMRKIIASEKPNSEKLEALKKLAEDEALEPLEIRPLPEAKPEDINLIAWLAISPSAQL